MTFPSTSAIVRQSAHLVLLTLIGSTLIGAMLSFKVYGQDVDFEPEPIMSITGEQGSYRGLQFSHHDRQIWNHRLECWDIPGGSASDGPPIEPRKRGNIFSAAAQGRRLIFFDAAEERLFTWGGVAPLAERDLPNRGQIRAIRFLEDGERFASWMSEPSSICLGSTGSPKEDRYFSIPEGLRKLEISRTGKMFISVGPDNEKSVLIWDLEKNEERATIRQKSVVASLSLSPDDRFLATGSFDNRVRVYDTESGRQLKVFKGHGAGPIFLGSAVFSVAFSPNGRWIASGGHDGQVIVWEVETGKRVFRARIKSQPIVWSVAFSQNSELVAGGFEGIGPIHGVGVWEIEAANKDK